MLNQSGFDLWADDYDKSVGLSDEANAYPFAGYKRLLGRIYEIVLQKERPAVLDLGFGTGVLTAKLYEAGCRIWGQDFSARMIELAREKMPEALLVRGDFSEGLAPVLRERTYDFIISTYAMHHLDFAGKLRLIREALDCLAPGGELLIGDVAFATQEAQEACRAAAGEEWDEDECYTVFEELKAVFPEAEFEPVSFCAGIFRWKKPEAKAEAGSKGPNKEAPADKLEVYIPRLEDGWFYVQMMSDPATMAYNAPWFPPDGCIPDAEAEWERLCDAWIGQEPERFYAFLLRPSDGAFVGDINFHYNSEKNWWDMGVVIYAPERGRGYGRQGLELLLDRAFRVDGIAKLHNEFETARDAAYRIHKAVGFREAGIVEGIISLELTREEYAAGNAAPDRNSAEAAVPAPDSRPLLETDRLLVRRFTPEDALALHAVLSDPEVMRYLEPPFSLERTEDLIRRAGLCEPPLIWAVAWKRTNEVIGHLIWHPWDETAIELGWVLRRDFWGRGIAKELTSALLARTDKDVILECSPEQTVTRHLAERFGFVPVSEGQALSVWRRNSGKEIRWIFFDLGSTLIDETEADARRIEEMTAGTGVTPEAYREKRLECLRQGLSGDAAAIAFFGLTKTPWHSELERPYPDAAPVLAELKRRGYRLGVIANQNPGTEGRLAAWDLLRYFDVLAPSAELGVAKPDPAIFRWALGQAGCKASEAVMVGDRLDNDIAAAKALGFRTVRLLRGLGAFHTPRSPAEEPEHTIRGLAELLDLMPCNAERADVGIGPYGGSRN